ncbi:OLC1v1036539C1 [Oldenlandia corymbosa var. corymbosa]|uniref:OLC1v1036539C1 n=1 Tax=Oldenlandia corymbosa var. corymbosa TaxID=529605 RepID=A0AAV1CW73_OLDCO|nr:OLC1v1036539C1 [Oldenlandia corymbosa var. corymbosa]
MEGNGVVRYRCGLIVNLVTYWKDDHPRRRFWGCPLYPRDDRCRFFRWHDPDVCARAKAIIPGLLRRCNTNDEEIRQLKKKLFWTQIAAIVLAAMAFSSVI